MPRRMKWNRDGSWPTDRLMDFHLDGLGRFQAQSGVKFRTLYDARKSAILEDWQKGGVWREAVKAIHAKHVTVAEWYPERSKGVEHLAVWLKRKDSAPLRPLIADYLHASRATDKRKMKQRLERLAVFIGKDATVADLTPGSIDHFLSSLIDQRTSKTTKKAAKGSTVNRYRAVIGGMCTWAVKHGRLDVHPIAGKKVEKRDEPHYRLPEMTPTEYAGYMAQVRSQRDDLSGLFLLLLHTAPDIGELFLLKARDVDLDAAQVIYQRTKTRHHANAAKPRKVPLPALVVTELRGHFAEHQVQGSELVFGMVVRSDAESMHQRAAKAISRPELTIKDLRHIAAIAWVKAGTHIRLVQKWLGHTSLNMTMRYTDYEPDEGMAQQMAERAADTLNQTAGVLRFDPSKPFTVKGDTLGFAPKIANV